MWKWAALVLFLTSLAPLTVLNASGTGQSSDDLNTVIAAMNSKAASFKNVSADFDWETHNAAMAAIEKDKYKNEVQTGQSYFRRSGKDVEIMLDILEPNQAFPKQLLYRKGTLRVYEPGTNKITEHAVGNSRSDVDAGLSLGFGGRGDDLLKSYSVKWLGWEKVDGIRTGKMELAGKTPGLQKAFTRAVIWIDPERNVAIQQQFFQEEGDYRLTHYRKITVNGDVSDENFKLRTKPSPEIAKIE